MEKYILRPNTELGYSVETVIDENTYSINITLPLQTNDALSVPFSKTITVVSNNLQTGFEVDNQRAEAINNYLKEINE